MTGITTYCYRFLMAKLKDELPDKQQVGERVRRLRLAFGYEQQNEFAAKTGVTPNRYNQWESGGRLVPLGTAIALCRAWGITLDFLYRGDWHGLPDAPSALLTGLKVPGHVHPVRENRRKPDRLS